MTAENDAYGHAQELIARAWAEGWLYLNLSGDWYPREHSGRRAGPERRWGR